MGKFIDVTGQKFGALTAIHPTDKRHDRSVVWVFKCDCGKEIEASIKSVKRQDIASCGCCEYSRPKNGIYQRNLVGQRFGHLTVIESLNNKGEKYYKSMVRCDCGNEFIAMDTRLVSGKKTMCPECSRNKNRKYNPADKALLPMWYAMKSRCTNPDNPQYCNYGGRGITINKNWYDDYNKFYEWAINNGYSKGLEIDRIDVNGNYEPSNCRWVDECVQANNKRNTRYVDYEGTRMPVHFAAKLSQIKTTTIIYRLNSGWNDYDATHVMPAFNNFKLKKGAKSWAK